MADIASTIQQTAMEAPASHRINVVREAIQKEMLSALKSQGILDNVAFIGGTSLRLLHELPRYSEDLDFIQIKSTWDTDAWYSAIHDAAGRSGGTVHMGKRPEIEHLAAATARGVIKRGISFNLSVTSTHWKPVAPQGIHLRMEFDLDPPAHVESANVALSGVAIPTLTLSSLMAGKMHILLTRPDREKGRDWFDYLWYRKRGVIPNLKQLQCAIDQTADGPDARLWTSFLRNRQRSLPWDEIRKDVSPFLKDPKEAAELNLANIDKHTPPPNFERIEEILGENDASSNPLERYVDEDLSARASEGDEKSMALVRAIEKLRARPNIPDRKQEEPEL